MNSERIKEIEAALARAETKGFNTYDRNVFQDLRFVLIDRAALRKAAESVTCWALVFGLIFGFLLCFAVRGVA